MEQKLNVILGDTRTFTICMCSDSEIAKLIASAMNLLDDNQIRLELD